MKARAFRTTTLLIAALSIAASSLQAAPSLPITKPPVQPNIATGPAADPSSNNGQWFLNAAGGEEYRTHEFHDNMPDTGGGQNQWLAINGKVSLIVTNAAGQITAFDIDAWIQNDTHTTDDGQESDANNSHGESRATGEERYVGTLYKTKLTAEFAIVDPSVVPSSFMEPYRKPPYPSWIIADNEDQQAWYCWNQGDPPAYPQGGYYVPTWDFGDIPTNQAFNRTLKFLVNPPMDASDPRYAVIFGSHNQSDDVFANRTSSLKISTWIDDLAADNTFQPYPENPLRSSDVSVFHNVEGEVVEEYDFGDAPDPLYTASGEYPTLLANNGARHKIVAGAPWFGDSTWAEPDLPDPEGDGQPDPNAMGDDNNGAIPDDEDGIAIPVLTPGWSSSITINVGQTGWVDGWIDWNADGKWQPAERVIGQVLPAGPHNHTVTPPAGAAIGFTFARFRIHSPDGIRLGPVGDPTQYGATDDGEVEDHLVEIVEGPYSDAKWLQPPDLTSNGFDVACRLLGDPPILLADDFLCTNHCAITNIIVWGSWLYDELPDGNPSNVMFTLSFHADRPAGTAHPWSIPGTNLWTMNFGPGQFSAKPITFDGMQEGWYDPSTRTYTTNADWTCWKYTFPIDILDAFVQTGTVDRPVIYWLDVQANPIGPVQVNPIGPVQQARFGWKTTRPEHRWNDDAAWTPNVELYVGVDWWDMHYPLGHPYNQWETNSFDLAFALFCGPEEAENLDWGDAPDAAGATGFNTLNANGGANHVIVAGMFLGGQIDPEPDGQPTPPADGDDLNINGLGGIPFPPGDEDGVVFISRIIPGWTASLQVTASVPGLLDAWMDLDGSGTWTAVDQIFNTRPLNAGVNNLSFPVPSTAVPGTSYARFRYSTVGGLPPFGPAADGEIEDYMVVIEERIDWGDAPDGPYPTLSASGGANHIILGGGLNPTLGSLIDPEPDGQPRPLADGDDTDFYYASMGDDEDGITWLTPFVPGAVAQAKVVVGGPGGSVDAWIDWNADGIWANPGERIMGTGALAAGSYTYLIPVPTNAVPATNTYARFRISSAGGLTPGGSAQDGEVEDYMLVIDDAQDIDWGDAPDRPYPTLRANNGAHHLRGPLYLGNIFDNEPDGQPTPNADGDDIDLFFPSAGDDEDGVNLTSLIQPGGYASVDVITSIPGFLDAWVDFNNDGSWNQLGDRIFTGQPLGPGLNSLIFPVPISAAPGNPAYARFRLSGGISAYPAGVSYTGLCMDGEVEDYEYYITPLVAGIDFGDAPNTYATLLPGGARHTITAGVMLGAVIDPEPDGQPSPAVLDDKVGLDDEDGVTFTSKIVAGTNATVDVVAGVLGGMLDAWVDFNADGTWSAGEHLFGASLPLAPGLNAGITTLKIPSPPYLKLGPTFARFRISLRGGLPPGGPAADGEVEDYQVKLYQPVPVPDILITNLFFKVSNTVAQVEWNSQTDIVYQVESSTNLTTNVWTGVGGWLFGPINWQTNAASPTTQFYRVTAPWTP